MCLTIGVRWAGPCLTSQNSTFTAHAIMCRRWRLARLRQQPAQGRPGARGTAVRPLLAVCNAPRHAASGSHSHISTHSQNCYRLRSYYRAFTGISTKHLDRVHCALAASTVVRQARCLWRRPWIGSVSVSALLCRVQCADWQKHIQ